MAYLDREQRRTIGYDYIVEKLNILSPYGKSILENLRPYKNEEDLKKEYESIEVASREKPSVERLLSKLKDIRKICDKCRDGHVLDEIELYELKVQGMTIERIREKANSVVGIDPLEDLIRLLDPRDENMPTYYIYSEYSNRLEKIREDKKEIEERIYLSPKNKELKEKRLRVVIDEGDEELVVRRSLSKKLSPIMERYIKNIESIGKLDLLLAKVRLNTRYNLVKPTIGKKIEARGLINLEIKDTLESKRRTYTPIDITLDSGTTIITGANMGGKSVALKTITLNLLLFQLGFYPMGRDTKMPILDFIEFISEDLQDVSKGLSTFGAEMMRVKGIMALLKRKKGFVALDEFARGTNPYEGQKLAKTLANYLDNYSSISLMATHYDGVATNNFKHYQVVGLRDIDFTSLKRSIDLNSRRSIEILQRYMDYTLEECSQYEAPKDALNIAMLLGIDNIFIDEALKIYREDTRCKES